VAPELGGTAPAADVFRDQIFSNVPADYTVVAYSPCSVLGPVEDVVCLVTEKHDGSKVAPPSRVLRMYRIERGAARQIFEYHSDNPLDSLSMINRTTLMAIWATGSGYQYTVFRRVSNGDIRLVLESGGRAHPEVADLEDDGIPEILITTWVLADSRRELLPTKTTVYRFKGDKYVQARVVPWAERFRTASKRAGPEK
jgi:hypothetical protein